MMADGQEKLEENFLLEGKVKVRRKAVVDDLQNKDIELEGRRRNWSKDTFGPEGVTMVVGISITPPITG